MNKIILLFVLLLVCLADAQTLTVISPNGGEELQSFTTIDIQWQSVDIPFIDIDYSTDNGNNWVSIMRFWPASQPLQWEVPGGNSDLCLIRARIVK